MQIKTVITITIAQWIITKLVLYYYRGGWQLFRAKRANFLAREIGWGRGVEERSLEMTEVSREGGRRWWRQESGLQIFCAFKITQQLVVNCCTEIDSSDSQHVEELTSTETDRSIDSASLSVQVHSQHSLQPGLTWNIMCGHLTFDAHCCRHL